MSWNQWGPYVSVADRGRIAVKEMEKLRKKGLDVQPVALEGRKIAKTFWGHAWCEHLESYSDYENRLDRGTRYVRNGSVCHLAVKAGEIDAYVSGSEIYKVKITVAPLPEKKWKAVKKRCSGEIGSLIDLIQGRLSESVMATVTDRSKGLFPSPTEIKLECDCPDYAVMCKHIAAVLYGVGARLDQQPELLFKLRGVDHEDLIDTQIAIADATGGAGNSGNRLADDSLADVFGIDLSEEAPPTPKPKISNQERSVTGEDVAAMRKKFGMSQREFSILLDVSTPTVGKWEKATGPLNLREGNVAVLRKAKRLSKKRAWEQFENPKTK